MLWSFVYLAVRNLFALVWLLARPRRSKELEILILRHELAILRRQRSRPQLTRADRALLASLSRSLARPAWTVFPIKPETLLRWHRQLIACGVRKLELQPQVPDWEIVAPEGIKRLRRTFAFDDFAQALAFTNRVGRLADEEGHHPLLLTEWGRTTVIRRALDGRFLGDRGAEGYGWSTGRSRLH